MASISSLGLPNPQDAVALAPTSAGNAANYAGLENASKDEFLKLLVAQLQNQDPLSPAKNEDFLAQLATFSSLEQLISINTAINYLTAQLISGSGDVPITDE